MTPGGHTDGDVPATAEEAQSNSLNNNDTDGDVAATAEEEPERPSNQQRHRADRPTVMSLPPQKKNQSAPPSNNDTGRMYRS